MGKKSKSKKEKEGVKFSKLLTPEQRRQFKEIGEPDPNQNWFEMFTPDLMQDLHTIMNSCSDNQRKCDYVTEELHAYGFQDVGLGTNIVTMSNPLYPGVVFKIALDECGIADNFNDCILEDVVPKYNHVFARDPSAMISVQERLVLMTPAQRELFMPRILDLLKELSKYFLIADLSPDMYLNYGITRDGDFRIIDGSDLYPLHQLDHEPTCTAIVGEHKKTGKFKYCEGKLKYTKDFKYLVCQKCGREYNPLELRPRKDVEKLTKILSDGLSSEEREELERREIQNILGEQEDAGEGQELNPRHVSFSELSYGGHEETDKEGPRTIFVDPEEDDDESDEDDKQAPAVGKGVTDGSCAEPVTAYGEGEPDKESSQSDEDGESEAMQDDSEDVDRDVDGFVNLRGKLKTSNDENIAQSDSQSNETADDSADIHNELMATADRCIEILKRFRDSDDPSLNNTYHYIMDVLTVGTDDKPGDSSESAEETCDQETPISLLDRVITLVNKMKLSSDPKDQKDYLAFKERFVENDCTNRNIHQSGEEESSEPHITYTVVNESDDNSPDSMPGVFLSIVGDFDKAYDNSGLPIFVTTDGKTVAKAYSAYELRDRIKEVIEEMQEEAEAMSHHDDPEDDSDDEPDEPKVIVIGNAGKPTLM